MIPALALLFLFATAALLCAAAGLLAHRLADNAGRMMRQEPPRSLDLGDIALLVSAGFVTLMLARVALAAA